MKHIQSNRNFFRYMDVKLQNNFQIIKNSFKIFKIHQNYILYSLFILQKNIDFFFDQIFLKKRDYFHQQIYLLLMISIFKLNLYYMNYFH